MGYVMQENLGLVGNFVCSTSLDVGVGELGLKEMMLDHKCGNSWF